MKKVICNYCGRPARLINSQEIYGTDYGMLWMCDCVSGHAFVGCHKKNNRPLGTLANSKLRKIRRETHLIFDRIWKEKWLPRKSAYCTLANYLGISYEKCHIAMFDEEMCAKTISFSKRYLITVNRI